MQVNSFAATAVAGGGLWMLAKFINNPHYVGSLRATAGFSESSLASAKLL